AGDYRPGDTVTVVGKTSMGLRAVGIAFVLPVFLVAAVLFVVSSAGLPERQAALTSLAALVFYYLVLYFFRNRFKQTFTFTIQ
ncbi:MAG: SoxR reducing system RseC family protein, partial [Dysgonamonadaceae bacterium]|nr:SoxR reducing system RseC family protein [Dysgonamonadaceae bacterium]